MASSGARLLFIVEEWQGFLAAPMNYILTGAGFTWYGGLFGGVAAVSWVLRKNKIPWLVGADMTVPALALAYGVGRLGCHFAGDGDWGAVTTVPWGVAYTKAIVGWADPTTGIPYASGVVVHPTPIYEFLQGLFVFAILWSLRKKGLAVGTITWLYLILAGLMRFIVEFWRINPSLGLRLFRGAVVQHVAGWVWGLDAVPAPGRRAGGLKRAAMRASFDFGYT